MNFEALIEFNKYTLALAAGGFVYALEKLGPMATLEGRIFLLAVLVLFLISAMLGLLVFAAATSGLHSESGPSEGLTRKIRTFGVAHAVTLCLAMLLLGGMLYDSVMHPPAAPASVAPPCE